LWATSYGPLILLKMKSEALIYVPSDTPEAMTMATRKIAGVPQIVRGIMTLAEAGLSRCTLLIAESQRSQIRRFLSRYREERVPKIEMISYDEPYRVSPDLILRIGQGMAKRCLLINANLLFEHKLVSMIRNLALRQGETLLCRAGAHPLPLYEITPAAWESLGGFTSERPRSIESCIARLLEVSRCRVVQKPPEMGTFLVNHLQDRFVAEKFLSESIRHSTSGPVAKYVNKRFSLPVSLILAKLWISPHVITGANILIGLFSGVLVADGHRYGIILLGALLFQMASIVDGCDGEVAKLTFRCSKFGQFIDSVSDNLSLGSFMTGLIAGYWRQTHSPVAFIVGASMLLGTSATLFWMIRYLKKNTASASLVTFDKEYLQHLAHQPRWLLAFIRYGKYTLKKDVFSFMFLCSAIAGALYWWLFIAAFGTMVSATILTYLNLRGQPAQARVNRAPGLKPHRRKSRMDGPKLADKEVIVFDFDGTVVDSMNTFADLAAEVMPKYYPVNASIARSMYLNTSGVPFFQQLELLFPNHQANATASEEFERRKLDTYFERPLFTDVLETVHHLKKRGIKTAVSSNNFQHLVESFVTRTGITFDLVLGYKTNFEKGQEHFAYIERRLGIGREAMAFVGDSIKDGERAMHCGVEFIGKEGIFSRDQFTERFPGARIISTLSELKELIP
jgi:phosphoglycolate phosphatase-like HAD superfamily hydrolase/phosphatidylglycerophosphate synthase